VAEAVARRRVSLEQVLFTGLALGFVGLLLVESFGYRPNVRLVPQIIGFPTFVLLSIILVRDVRQYLMGSADMSEEDAQALSQGDVEALAVSGDLGDALRLAAKAQEDDAPEELTAESRRRLMVFGGWVVAFALTSDWFGFIFTFPIGLLLIFLYATRKPLFSLMLAGGTSAAVYLLFVTILEVRF